RRVAGALSAARAGVVRARAAQGRGPARALLLPGVRATHGALQLVEPCGASRPGRPRAGRARLLRTQTPAAARGSALLVGRSLGAGWSLGPVGPYLALASCELMTPTGDAAPTRCQSSIAPP